MSVRLNKNWPAINQTLDHFTVQFLKYSAVCPLLDGFLIVLICFAATKHLV